MENLHEQLEAIEDYTSVLEEALVALCEELDIDPQALVEDIMTSARQREHSKALGKMERKVDHYATGPSVARAWDKEQSRRAQAQREGKSKKLYGRGGKVLKRQPTAKEASSSDRWNEKRDAAKERRWMSRM
jgi:hypothetical protein